MRNLAAPSVTRKPGLPRLTRDQAACLDSLANQERITSFPYYSTVKLQALAVGNNPGPYTYTIATGQEVRAFSYGVRTPGTAAGFTVGDGNMTPAETNLQTANQTNNGQHVVIYGLGCIIEPGGITEGTGLGFTDGRLVAEIATNVSIEISLNGDEQRYRLGKLANIEGHGGIRGSGYDSLGPQPIAGGRPGFDFMTNGSPVEHNYFRMPEGMIWKPKGSTDGELNIILTVVRDIVLHSGGDVANNIAPQGADELGAAGVRGYEFPAKVLALLTFYLKGWVLAARSGVS